MTRRVALAVILSLVVGQASSAGKYTTTSFVPPAVPHRLDPATSWKATASQLWSKKKSSVAPKKIQVKLLKHIAGTGQAGEVVMVTPAFFNNKLKLTKAAEVISDDQLEKERNVSAKDAEQKREMAEELRKKISAMNLTIKRKAGPDGQLFGGIGPKVVKEELQNLIGGEDFFDQKSVKVSVLLDEDGKQLRGDIRHTGEFEATISLTKDLSTKVKIVVLAE